MHFKFRLPSKFKAKNEGKETIITFPDELLLQILEALNDQTLYLVSKTCQRLHRVSLHVLFSRWCPAFLTSGQLNLRNHPLVLLPALRSALFITPPTSICIYFDNDIPVFLSELQLLTNIVERSPRLSKVDLHLESLYWRATPMNYPTTEALRDKIVKFMEFVVQHCDSLAVSGGRDLAAVFRFRWNPPKIPTSKHPKGLKARWNQIDEEQPAVFGRSLDLTKLVPLVIKRQPSPIKVKHILVPPIPVEPIPPSREGSTLKTLHIHSPLLVETAFFNHTYLLCNNFYIGELSITPLTCPSNAWYDFFSLVKMSALKTFAITANYSDLIFAKFLERHSETLESLTVRLNGPVDQSASTSVPFSTESKPLTFSFPQLCHLSGHMTFLERFLASCLTTSERQQHVLACLPSLRSLAIQLHIDDKNPTMTYTRITETLNTMARIDNFNHNRVELARSISVMQDDGAAPSSSGGSVRGTNSEMRSWIRQLEINPVTLDTLLPWLDVHLKKRWATLTFHGVKELYINSSSSLGDGFFDVLPQFCFQFPNIRLLKLSPGSDAVKKRKATDWEALKGVCPDIKYIWIEEKILLEVDDLANGRWLPKNERLINDV